MGGYFTEVSKEEKLDTTDVKNPLKSKTTVKTGTLDKKRKKMSAIERLLKDMD